MSWEVTKERTMVGWWIGRTCVVCGCCTRHIAWETYTKEDGVDMPICALPMSCWTNARSTVPAVCEDVVSEIAEKVDKALSAIVVAVTAIRREAVAI